MNTRPPPTVPHPQSGLTLIELMISMLLGLLLMLGVVNVYLSQVQSYRLNDNLGQIQNSARTAFELMSRELREAGGNPCGTPVVVNTTGATGSDWRHWDQGALIGYTGTDDMTDAAFGEDATERVEDDTAPDTSAGLVIRSASIETPVVISAHAGTTYTVAAGVSSFEPGEVLMACDYARATLFTAAAGTDATSIVHPAPGTNPYPTGANGFASRLSTTAWYIGNNASGGRSLFRVLNGGDPAEIAAGVVGMQLSYLTRTGSALATDYVAADDISSWANDAASPVVAVRIVLDLESRDSIGTDGNTIKQQMQHVVALRHREIIK